MKKEEYSSIAKNLQNISDGTLSIERTQTGENIGKTFFTEQFQAMTIGKGRMEVHNVYPGIEASFNTFLAPEIHFQHSALDSVLEIHYCRNGRIGWNMRGGTAIYLGSGDLTAHSMACCSNSTMMFPLGYSEGVSLSVDLEKLSTVCPEILQSAGVASNLLWEKFCSGKPSAIPTCSDLEHIFAPLFSAPAPMRLPLLKLKVLEVLIYLGNMKSGRKELTQYFSQQTELIKEIRQQLTEHLEQRFTIEELSKQYKNKTEWNDPDPIYSGGIREQLEDYFYQSLEVDLLLRLCPDDEDTIYQIVDLLVDTCSTKRKMLRIAGDDKPTEVVRSRLKKLNADHIRFVLDSLAENTAPVRNMKQYLLAMLYNAPTTMNLYYQNKTNHDFARGSPKAG